MSRLMQGFSVLLMLGAIGCGQSAAAEDKPAAAVAPAPAADGDVLKFDNGDSLHGTLVGVTPKEALQWRHPEVKQPIAFALDHLREVQLAPRPPRTPRTPHRLMVELTNGDRLAGDLVALNGETLKLNTWYAGTLELKRAMLRRVVCQQASPEALYAGPTGLAGWTSSEGNRAAWKFKGGAFYSPYRNSGTLGRNVGLPEMASIEFDLGWRGQLYLQVGFYFDNLQNMYSSGGYSLQINNTSAYLYRHAVNRGSNNLGNNVELPKLQAKSKAHFALRVNKAKKLIALYVDNELVKQWTDPADFAGTGQGLILCSQGQGAIRISNIMVTPWDGRLETEPALSAPGADDVIRFANGDKVSGALRSIAKGEALVQTSFSEMKVPLARVAQIEFANQKTVVAHRQPDDVRAAFLDGSRFTLALEKLDEQTLVGSTENCGRVTTALDAFSRVQFRIYEPRPEAGDDDEWGGTPEAGAVMID